MVINTPTSLPCKRALAIICHFSGGMLLNSYMKEPEQPPQACVIWMHGLGADAQDMAALATQLPITVPIRHIFLDAPVRAVTLNNHMPMRAWYDIVGKALTDREDRDGILQSEGMIREAIDRAIQGGFSSQQIFLAGFSQGGAMALFAGIRLPMPLAGIITLSAYLPLSVMCKSAPHPHTPIFAVCGQYDSMVLPAWSKISIEHLRQLNFKHIEWHEYPMAHAICLDEINDLARWLNTRVEFMTNRDGGEL